MQGLKATQQGLDTVAAQGLEMVAAQLALLPGVLEQRDAARQLPLTLARRRGHAAIAEVLRAAGAHERGAGTVCDGAAPRLAVACRLISSFGRGASIVLSFAHVYRDPLFLILINVAVCTPCANVMHD